MITTKHLPQSFRTSPGRGVLDGERGDFHEDPRLRVRQPIAVTCRFLVPHEREPQAINTEYAGGVLTIRVPPRAASCGFVTSMPDRRIA
ncbi:MAG: hypothetical protein AB7R89_00985 [Dehalococcoidia bacterium]